MKSSSHILICVLGCSLMLGSCKKKDEGSNSADTFTTTSSSTTGSSSPTVSPSFLHWTSERMPDQSAIRDAIIFKDGKIYATPYTYSTDNGLTWITETDDGLGRKFERWSGFLTERKKGSGNGYTYTQVPGTAVLTTTFYPTDIAWRGGQTAYAITSAVSGVLKTVDGGVTWTLMQSPPLKSNFLSFSNVAMFENTICVVQIYRIMPGNYTKYVIQATTDGGVTWKESEEKSESVKFVEYLDGVLYANLGSFSTSESGVYKIKIDTAVRLESLETKNGLNVSNSTCFLKLPGGELLIGTELGYYIPDPTSGKFYNASSNPAVINAAVLVNGTIVATAYKNVFTTAYPFQFFEHE